MSALAERKAALREAAAAARARAHAGGADGPAAGLTGVLAAHAGKVLSGYMPMRTEADPLPAMAAHAAGGGPVCVPVIAGKGLPLRFRDWTPVARMVPGPFGARVPAEGAWRVPQVLIVPLLAFDRSGYRLGYGGGFYDRTLAALRAGAGPEGIVAVGFGFAAQEVAEVPRDANDARLDLIVTEAGVIAPR